MFLLRFVEFFYLCFIPINIPLLMLKVLEDFRDYVALTQSIPGNQGALLYRSVSVESLDFKNFFRSNGCDRIFLLVSIRKFSLRFK